MLTINALKAVSLASGHVRLAFCELTPGLRLDDLELRPGRHLVVFSDLPPHAETQRHHVVFLAVGRQTSLDVIQQRRLQTGALKQDEHAALAGHYIQSKAETGFK